MASDRCTVCSSLSTVEWYPSDADPENLSFQYMKSPDVRRTFRVVRCRSCSHVFCSPLPRDLFARYQDVVDDEYLRHTEARRLTAHACLDLIRRHAKGGTLLDVGCATGDFVAEAAAAGYQAEGLELSRWACTYARDRGLVVHEQRLGELSQRRPGAYDVVTLWGVIEHFEHPQDEIRHIATLLKPGGILVIWTGDVNSITSRLLGRLWWYWLGQHIQYFTARSLSRLWRRCRNPARSFVLVPISRQRGGSEDGVGTAPVWGRRGHGAQASVGSAAFLVPANPRRDVLRGKKGESASVERWCLIVLASERN